MVIIEFRSFKYKLNIWGLSRGNFNIFINFENCIKDF